VRGKDEEGRVCVLFERIGKEKRQRGNVCRFKREEGGKTKDRKGEGKRGKRKKERQKHRRGLI